MKWEFRLQTNPALRKAELDIYDVVGDPYFGVTSQGVLWQLRQLDVDELLIRINSIGGVVSEGMDIYNLLREHPAKKVCRISGVAASIATVIALAGDRVEIFKNSQFMIHDPYATFDYQSPPLREEDLRRNADLLARTKSAMFAMYEKKTGLPPEEIAQLCSQETWMTAEEAVARKFCDAVLDGETDGTMLTMQMSARAWDTRTLASLKAPKILRQAAQAAQTPNRAQAQTQPAVPAQKRTPQMARKKLRTVALGIQKSKTSSVVAIIAALSTVFARVKAEEITDEDLDALRSELEETSAAAEELESALEEAKTRSEEFEKNKAELEETKSRAAKAAEELEEVKKNMEALKGASDDEEIVDEDDEEDIKSEARTELSTASRKTLRSIARAAMRTCGVQSVARLEGALMAYKARGASGADAKTVRAALVERLYAEGKVTPATKKWALVTSDANLQEYLGHSTAQVVPGRETAPSLLLAQQHADTTPGAFDPSVTSADEPKIKNLMGTAQLKRPATA